MSVDPLSNKYPGWSPYNYVQDDPTGLLDPTGMGGISYKKKHATSATYETTPITGTDRGNLSVTTVTPKTIVKAPFLKLTTYAEATGGNENSTVGITVNGYNGTVESNTYRSPNGIITTTGADNTWFTMGIPSIKLGRTVKGQYIANISIGLQSGKRVGISLRVDSPSALARQASEGFSHALDVVGKFIGIPDGGAQSSFPEPEIIPPY